MSTPSCPTQTPPAWDRQQAAQNVRDTAQAISTRAIPTHRNNCEEADYPSRIFSYSKALRHDALGNPDTASYSSLLSALQQKTHAAFEAVQDGPGPKRLTNPQGGLQFQLEGYDPQAVTMQPAPRMDRPRGAAEMAELYWMALARDVPFINYAAEGSNPNSVIARAARSLSSPWFVSGGEFTEFFGPREGLRVTPRVLFRGVYPGETVGPYISQFLLKGNAEPGAPAGDGLTTKDGMINYGAQVIPQKIRTVVPGVDHLTDFNSWLQAQNGADFRGGDQFDPTRRFIRSLRDLGEYVHNDLVINAWYNACWILLSEPIGNQVTADPGRIPMRDREFPFDQGNPYGASTKQEGFITLGPVQALQIVCDVITRAGAAVWFQKWFVHRRLRPEELGGRIDNHLNHRQYYPINYQILTSLRRGLLSLYFPRNGSFLLPQQYSEGAPTHPAYGAGHATISGACATILKAYFNEDTRIENPVQANADGSALVDYTGADRSCMTVEGELNKLAGNIAIGRNSAGVHWRSDYDQSLLLGEQIAIQLLREITLTMSEPESFNLTTFGGRRIRIQNGQLYRSRYTYRPSLYCQLLRYPIRQVVSISDPTPKYAYEGAPHETASANPEYETATATSTGTAEPDTYDRPAFREASLTMSASPDEPAMLEQEQREEFAQPDDGTGGTTGPAYPTEPVEPVEEEPVYTDPEATAQPVYMQDAVEDEGTILDELDDYTAADAASENIVVYSQERADEEYAVKTGTQPSVE